MDNWFKSKWFVRGLSLALAILIYIFVNIEVNTSQTESRVPGGASDVQTVNDVPVDIRMDAERFVVSGVPEYVSVTLEGMTSLLTPIVIQRNFDVFVDLEDLEEGTHTVELEHDRVPEGLSVYIEPKTIEVTIEERASKEFSVTADFVNVDKLPAGYELGEAEVNPDTVVITSSKSVIDKIALVRVYIDVADMTEPIKNREIPVNVYDGQGNELSVHVQPENVIVSVPLDHPSKVVPLEVSTEGKLPEGYSVVSMEAEREEVEVFAKNDILSDITKLETEPISLNDMTESGTINATIDLPEGAAVSNDTVKVKVVLEQKKTFDDVSVELTGESSDQDVSFLSHEKINVTVSGEQSVISRLKAEDIKLTASVKGLSDGEHEVDIEAKKIDGVDIELAHEKAKVEVKS